MRIRVILLTTVFDISDMETVMLHKISFIRGLSDIFVEDLMINCTCCWQPNSGFSSENTKLKILFSVQFREHKAKNKVLQFFSKCHSCPHDHQIAKYRTKYKTGELGWDTKDLSCEICIYIFRSYTPTFLQFLVILVICMTLFASKSWNEFPRKGKSTWHNSIMCGMV